MNHRGPPSPAASADPRELDERRLVEGLLARSPAAVSEFLERTHHPVFCLACRLTHDRDLRRDWSHAVLLAILDDLERGRFVYKRPGGFWTWFRKRAYYRLLDEYRRHRQRSRREEPGDDSWTEVAAADDPAMEMERIDLLSALEACLERLANADQRRALTLLLVEDQTYEQIARAMGAPLNTVRAWIRRSRIAVRQCLSRDWDRSGGRIEP